MKRKLAMILLISMTLSLLTACAPATPSEVAERYLSALKNNNAGAMADCLAPEAAKQLRELSALLGSTAKGQQLWSISPGLVPPPVGEGEVYHINIEITGEQIEEDTAWVSAEIEYVTDEQEYMQELLLTLEQRGSRWYISGG